MSDAAIYYYYSIRSAFAYLGAPRINALAAKHERCLLHRPIQLSITMPPIGAQQFDQRPPLRNGYLQIDLKRWADYLDVPIHIDPIHHNGPMELPSGAVIAAQRAAGRGEAALADVDLFSFKMLEALWRDDRDIADASVIGELARDCGFNPDTLIEEALSPAAQLELERNNREAIVRGVMGSPTYFIDGENFYGQDRLDFAERRLASGAKR